MLNLESNFTIEKCVAADEGVTIFLLNPSLKRARERSCLDDRHILTAEENIAFITDNGEQTTLHRYFVNLFARSLSCNIYLRNNNLRINEFKDTISSPLQLPERRYQDTPYQAEAIATYYVRQIYGFMMKILVL